jgi:DNA primase
VSEVVFAFDGDRAGRAAAWRALQNALPEAREGREIRFLFLPEGEDPDSLVGAEGCEAFERRLESALPLSEYLVAALAAEVDLTHADGRARFAELARPLHARVPEGVYRELLLARLAETIRLSPERLEEAWRRGGAPLRAAAGAAAVPASPSVPLRRGPARAATSAGRGGLVRQAVRVLLHHPGVVSSLGDAGLGALGELEGPGVDVLRRLIEELRLEPARHTAQVLERWRDRPEGERLARLAAAEAPDLEPAAAARELAEALERLRGEGIGRRIDRLIEKERESGLEPDEKAELLRLMSSRHPAPASAAGSVGH